MCVCVDVSLCVCVSVCVCACVCECVCVSVCVRACMCDRLTYPQQFRGLDDVTLVSSQVRDTALTKTVRTHTCMNGGTLYMWCMHVHVRHVCA